MLRSDPFETTNPTSTGGTHVTSVKGSALPRVENLWPLGDEEPPG